MCVQNYGKTIPLIHEMLDRGQLIHILNLLECNLCVYKVDVNVMKFNHYTFFHVYFEKISRFCPLHIQTIKLRLFEYCFSI